MTTWLLIFTLMDAPGSKWGLLTQWAVPGFSSKASCDAAGQRVKDTTNIKMFDTVEWRCVEVPR